MLLSGLKHLFLGAPLFTSSEMNFLVEALDTSERAKVGSLEVLLMLERVTSGLGAVPNQYVGYACTIRRA